jgi:hypothetical protein
MYYQRFYDALIQLSSKLPGAKFKIPLYLFVLFTFIYTSDVSKQGRNKPKSHDLGGETSPPAVRTDTFSQSIVTVIPSD